MLIYFLINAKVNICLLTVWRFEKKLKIWFDWHFSHMAVNIGKLAKAKAIFDFTNHPFITQLNIRPLHLLFLAPAKSTQRLVATKIAAVAASHIMENTYQCKHEHLWSACRHFHHYLPEEQRV
jgi:hypothetical protein